MKFFVISTRSNFLQTPGITGYHSCMFHGVSGRNGKWYPDDDYLDFHAPQEHTPQVMVNQHNLSDFIWPGRFPVVLGRLRQALGEIPNVRFTQATVSKVIDYKWSPGTKINISPGDLSDTQVYESMEECVQPNVGPLFEMQGLPYKDLPQEAKSGHVLSIELGAAPLPTRLNLKFSHDVFQRFPVFYIGPSMLMTSNVFDILREHVENVFYVVREFEFSAM